MSNATRLYTTLVEGKLNAKKFYETNDLSYYTQEVNSSFSFRIKLILFSFH